MLSKKHKLMIKSAVALDMVRQTPDLEISGLTSTDDIIECLESGKTRLYTDDHVARLVSDTVIKLADLGLIAFDPNYK